jgi:predicted secreted hydrolase
MMRYLKLGLAILSAAALMALAWLAFQPAPRREARAALTGALAPDDISGYARAFEPRPFAFPADHGPHPEYQTEWWYYTGNLRDAAGRHFGFQVTFFRRALAPAAGLAPRASRLAASQLYFAHFAVTDTGAGSHAGFERFSRGAGGLAGACARGSAEPCQDGAAGDGAAGDGPAFRVFLENWSATALDAAGDTARLVARDGSYALDLALSAARPPVAHGDRGLSPKSGEPGNASYYYSFTRLEAAGQVSTPSGAFEVTGQAWMDHEWSTSALGAQARGWDWFSIQLDGRRELMVFQIRNADGSLEPASSGTLVEPDGTTARLSAEAVQIEVLERWRSPATGGEYPVRWRLKVPSQDIDLLLAARLPDQEMRVSIVYWEGAVAVSGTVGGRPVSGQGYVEMTGYAQSINGKF